MKKNYNAEIKELTAKLSKNNSILAIYLFGSYPENFRPMSDIDICVIGQLNKIQKKKILRDFSEKFDISFFDELPITIKIKVFSEGKELFSRDKEKLHELKWETLYQYREIAPFIQQRINSMLQNA